MSKMLEEQVEKEIRLRGLALNVSTKFEAFLMQIVYFSNSDQYINPKESKWLKIKSLTFGGKIERVKELLTIYHADLLAKYDELFIELIKFLDMRNKLAHCAIFWIDEKPDHLEIWDVLENPDKFQFYAPIKSTGIAIERSIIWYLSKIVTPLTSLQTEVELRLKLTDPRLFSVLTSALSNGDQEKQNP